MIYRRYTPPAPLSAYVHCFWFSDGFDGTHQRERLLPTGESTIVFDLREQPVCIHDAQHIGDFKAFDPAVFCGARSDSFLIDTSQQQRVVGIQFKPGCALPFLDMPASEAAHDIYALNDIWPRRAVLLREQLMFAADSQSMFLILEQELLIRFSKWIVHSSGTLHPAVIFSIGRLRDFRQTVRVAEVAEEVGLSSRHFIDIFRSQTGLSPKAFQRVRRFQQVLQTLRARADLHWAELAVSCGYYDQAHFIHDFREFSGVTPGEYITIVTPHLNHLPVK